MWNLFTLCRNEVKIPKACHIGRFELDPLGDERIVALFYCHYSLGKFGEKIFLLWEKYQPAWGGFWGHFSNDWVYFWSLKVVFEFLSDLSPPGLEIVSEILSPVGPPKKRVNFDVFKNMKNANFVFWPPNHHLRSTRQSLTFEYLDPPLVTGCQKSDLANFGHFRQFPGEIFFVVKNFLGLASSLVPCCCWWVGWWLWRAGCISQHTYLHYV